MNFYTNLQHRIIDVKNFGLLIALLFCFIYQTAAQNFGLDGSFNGGVSDASSNNYVSATQPDGKILVGGSFRFVNGVSRSYLVRLNADGTLDTTFNAGGTGPGGDVLEIIVLSGGKILIGGSFISYNGVTVNKLTRLNADGTLDTTFNTGGTGVIGGGRIVSIAPQTDGKFVVAGQTITGYNGNASNGIFRINADGSFDSSFVSGFATSPGLEQVVVQADGKILIGGGNMTTYGGMSITRLIRVNSNGTLDFSFPLGGDGGDAGIAAIAIQSDGKILIGGAFTAYNAVARNSIARINADGTLDTSFVPPTSAIPNYVEYFVIQADGKVLAAGALNQSNGTMLPVMRLNTNGTQDTTLNAVADNLAYHVSLQPDGKILGTGFFYRYTNGEIHGGIARYNTNGTLDNTFNPTLTGFGVINVIVRQTDGKIIVGGRFRLANGNQSSGIARFNADGTFDNTFAIGAGVGTGANFTAFVNALAVQPDGKILVGGTIGNFNGSTSRVLVRLNSNGSVDTTFTLSGDVNLDLLPNIEDILVLPDGKIMIGGTLRNAAFQIRGLLRLNANGSVDETFNSGGIGANSTVWRVLRQTDGKYIIVGAFSTYNGTSRPRVARINTDGTLDTTFTVGTGANTTINDATLQQDGKILIGGAFTTYNGTTINRIARLNADGTLDNSFNVGSGANNTVVALAIQPDGKVLISGLFTDIGGISRSRFARLNSNGSLDTSLVSGFENPLGVSALLLQPDGKLIVGGSFSSYNGAAKNNLLRLIQSRSPFDYDGDNKTDLSIFRPAPAEWWILRSSNGSNFATQFGAITDKIVPADYTGDGKTDVAFWRPSNGTWFILRSEDLSFFAFPFGANGDVPVPADYDGDGKADAAVFRESTLTWYINKSSGGTDIIGFGAAGDKPVVADYDGDGKADIAIYRNNGGVSEWWIRRSSTGVVFAAQFGAATDKAVQGDYTGDGKTDIAFWRPSTGEWFILRSEDFSFYAFPFGANGDVSVPGDYDGDGKFDAGVFRPSNSTWFIQRSTAGTLIQQFGITGDLPTPNAFVP